MACYGSVVNAFEITTAKNPFTLEITTAKFNQNFVYSLEFVVNVSNYLFIGPFDDIISYC